MNKHTKYHYSDDDKSSLHDDYFIIAIDSTGIKVSNRGELIRHKWNVKRLYENTYSS